MQPCILTIDIGTSSTRVLLYDALAVQMPRVMAQAPNRPTVSPAGDVTFDFSELLQTLVAMIDLALQQAGPQVAEIAAVAISSFAASLIGVSDTGVAVTPVLTYAHPSSAPDAAALRRELGPDGADEAYDRTGCCIHSSYLPARMRWIQRAAPQWLAQCRHWGSVGEHVVWQFTGQTAASYSIASWTGLLDRRRLCWDAAWFDRLPVAAAAFSPLTDAMPLPGKLSTSWAKRWPALRHALWIPAIGDGAAANIGSGCTDGQTIALTIGTTGAMRVVVPPTLENLPSGLWLYRITGNLGLLGGATTEGGNLLKWLQDVLRLPPPEELEKAIAHHRPDSHGLTVLPFVAGERAPGWHDAAQAIFQGMTPATTPTEIYIAVLEAIAYRFAQIQHRLAQVLTTDAAAKSLSVVASGGALTKSPAWMQLMADVLGIDVIDSNEPELTARGAAVLALLQLGLIDRLDAFKPAAAAIYRPDLRHRARYDAAIRHQAELYAHNYGTAQGQVRAATSE